ncbi:MAG TPA: hypothetical protein VLE53_20110 [Gemmatimonadaceae bacterium]|nr:hypothetical protein [Gemmatimonadaceae bacterium]
MPPMTRIATKTLFALACAAQALGAQQTIATTPAADPRVGLRPGATNPGTAIRNLELIANRPKPPGFFNAENPLEGGFSNSDLAFRGNLLFQGNYTGWMIWDISTPANPVLRRTVLCPGNQGDPSVYGNLLFISIQATSARLDCGMQGVPDTVSTERFRGVRIYDISDIENPKAVAAVQTCRGSHTHTLVKDPDDNDNVYVYVSGTSSVRPGAELAGCSGLPPDQDPNTALFRIEVIQVPLAAPQTARVVSTPRLFADSTGNIAGLWRGGSHGEGTQTTSATNRCHDITAYPEIGLAAGACSGNGILLDIRDPINPKRIAEVSDPNFAYWHSATFNNDGTKLLFTDEWGGGSRPRCRATDRPQWGADAIYTLQDGKLTPASFFKLPAAQTDQENCVAHNGSLIPVPGRDIFVQGWYQGGISVIDFTDAAHPVEIAFFDRGPMDSTRLVSAGQWSTYWYNGRIYGSEIARGLDVLELKPSEHLSQNEIDAAKLVRLEQFNAQLQPRITWPAAFPVARAYLDQLVRNDRLRRPWADPIYGTLQQAERAPAAQRAALLSRLAEQLRQDAAGSSDAVRVRALADVVRQLAMSR